MSKLLVPSLEPGSTQQEKRILVLRWLNLVVNLPGSGVHWETNAPRDFPDQLNWSGRAILNMATIF